MVCSRHGICSAVAFPPHQRNYRDHREFRNDGTFGLGPGAFESAYQACLAHELRSRGLEVAAQVPQPVVYKGQKLEVGYRIDLAVEGRVVVEVKSVDAIHPIHHAQLLSYMRLSGLSVGLLINFNVLHLRDGIKRMVDVQDWEK
jgi:GxxExxY protein